MSFQDIQNNKKSGSRSKAQAVAACVFQINSAVASFRRLVDALGTAKDTHDHRQKLHNTRQRILKLVKETSAELKNLTESDRGANPSKKIEDAKLTKDFQTSLQEFQKIQQLASERESSYAPVAPQSSLPSGSQPGEEPAFRGDQERQPFLVEQKRQELVLLENEIDFHDTIIEEREHGIREVEEQIGQTNAIFKDLAVLVLDQGVKIDDIESNVDSSSASTSQGRTQLAKASKTVKAKSSWCWWVLVGIVLVLVILLIILVV